MNSEPDSIPGPLVAAGRRYYWRLLILALVLNGGLILGELRDLHALGFVLAGLVLTALVTLLFWGNARRGKLRWVLFMALLINGGYGFVLGGLQLGDPQLEQAVGPMCYILSAMGLGLVGVGGYLLYSVEVDAFLRSLREPQPNGADE